MGVHGIRESGGPSMRDSFGPGSRTATAMTTLAWTTTTISRLQQSGCAGFLLGLTSLAAAVIE